MKPKKLRTNFHLPKRQTVLIFPNLCTLKVWYRGCTWPYHSRQPFEGTSLCAALLTEPKASCMLRKLSATDIYH